MIRKLYAGALALLATISLTVSPAYAANLTVKDGAGATQMICAAFQSDSSLGYCFVYHNAAGAQEDLATKALQQAVQSAPGTSAATATGIQGVTAGVPVPVDTVFHNTAVDRGGLFGTSATALMPANAARHGIQIQVQTSGATCYINGQAGATQDFHSLMISAQTAAGAYYENPILHVGTGALSIICSAANTSVYAREE